MTEQRRQRPRWLSGPAAVEHPPEVEALLCAVGRGDESAFGRLFDLVAPRVYGLARRVMRDPVQAEDVVQEAMVEVWQTASRFDPARGSATAWIFTITHRRSVDRVRAEQAAADRHRKVAAAGSQVPFDEVAEEVSMRVERQLVRRCLKTLTELQRQAITLAYYGGHTYGEVATLLGAALPTVKARMRDGLIRLRDCLGVGVDQ